MLDKAIRDLDRERMGLQNQEKKLVAEIKKTAKQGQMVLIPSASPVLQCCYKAGIAHWMKGLESLSASSAACRTL